MVRVDEPDPESGFSQASAVRKALHKFSEFSGIVVADNLIRKDATYPWGTKMPYEEAEKLFKQIMP